jgi:hypothetical protein
VKDGLLKIKKKVKMKVIVDFTLFSCMALSEYVFFWEMDFINCQQTLHQNSCLLITASIPSVSK